MKPDLHRPTTLAGIAIAAVVALLLAILLAIPGVAENRGGDSGAGPSDTALVGEVMSMVKSQYVEPVGTDRLVSDALKGMLSGLDPHSAYMTQAEYEQMQSDTRGEFSGIGVQIALQKGVPMVIALIDGTPAARAGLDPGDLIVEIDGQTTLGMSVEDIVGRIRGPAGTTVKLQIARTGRAPFDVTLTRGTIRVASVTSHLAEKRIGYVHVSAFEENTPDEFTAAIAGLKRQAGGKLKGLVLDLRNDPGGLLDAAVDVTDDLLDGGVVVTIHGRQPADDRVYTAPAAGDRIPGTRMVVLINGASASASEIVAGALQDQHRATIMGTRSFGKGSVQTIIPLHGRGALRLTTARYYTPSGRSIQDRGIVPDIVVGLPRDEQVPNANFTREANLPRALVNTGPLDAGSSTLPEGGRTPAGSGAPGADAAPIDPAMMGTARDDQLQAALRYLQSPTGGNPAPRG